jgi:predicted amidophosphoribosyltransferase
MLEAAISGQGWYDRIDAFVAVPITLSNRLRYGFEPAALLASHLAKRMGPPSLPLLKVGAKTHNQQDLPASARASNVRDVFHIKPSAQLEGTSLCIVDDVATTGATIREIARVLKSAGCAEVFAATIAKTSGEL